MARADRLIQLTQVLRRYRRPVTAAMLAEEMAVSERTIYRDIVSLQISGVPVRGEAGIGYVLESGRVVLEGTSAELSGNDAVRSAYLGL